MQAIIGPDDALTVGELLWVLGTERRTPEELRDPAVYWSAALEPTMEAADLQTVSWLLTDAAADRRVSVPTRDRCRYWSAYLESRLVS